MTSSRLSLRALAAAALTALCASFALAQTPPPVEKKGAVFEAKINTELNSKTSKSGDPFSMTVISTLFHRHPELEGATIDGHVENVSPASSTKKASMSIIFDDITFKNGTTEPISVAVNKMSQLEPKTHTMRDAAIIIGGAVTGHIISKKTGHGGGTLAGAAAGFALVSSLKSDIDIKRGTQIELKLQNDLPAAA